MKQNKNKLILINVNLFWIIFVLLRELDFTKMWTGMWIAVIVNSISILVTAMIFVFVHKENLSLVLQKESDQKELKSYK